MKITVYGKSHMKGTSKKTGNPYDLTVVHMKQDILNFRNDNSADTCQWISTSQHML